MLLAGVLYNNMLCKQDVLLQNFQNLKLGINRVGGSWKIKIKLLSPRWLWISIHLYQHVSLSLQHWLRIARVCWLYMTCWSNNWSWLRVSYPHSKHCTNLCPILWTTSTDTQHYRTRKRSVLIYQIKQKVATLRTLMFYITEFITEHTCSHCIFR